MPTPPPPAKQRLIILMVFCCLIAGAVVTRAAYFQLMPNPKLEQMAKRQFESKVLIRPRRGNILDRNGEPLAINSEIDSLAANPSKIKNSKTLARLLSKALNIPFTKIFQKIDEKREFIWIKRHLTENDQDQLRRWRIINGVGDLPEGLFWVKESQRIYPHRELAAQVLGDVNVDSEGLEGVELQMNERLQGKVVSVSAVKDALGRPTFIDAAAAKHLQNGEDISLTLDASLQYAVEASLRHSVQKTGSKSGSVLILNAITGEILAMANEPSYNPNLKNTSPERRRNRLVTDGYEPGSTLKAVLAASALSHGMKSTDLVWGERGQFMVQGKKISEAEAHEKFEWLSLKKMMKVSSNVGAAKFALKLGADAYYSTLQDFGFSTKSNLKFPGEISGKVPARKAWTPLALANIGFGQGILVTRLQMARAYAAFLNGGWLVEPLLYKDLNAPPPTPRRVLSQKAAAEMLSILESTTEEGGTSTKAVLEGYRVAGKTGTAQVAEAGRYSRNKFIASFIGFPLEVAPKVVILVTLEEPKGNYYASETAAPLFQEVLNSVVHRFSIPNPGASKNQLLTQFSGQFSGQFSAPLSGQFSEVPALKQVRAAPPSQDQIHTQQAAPLSDSLTSLLIKVENKGAGSEAEPGKFEWAGSNEQGEMLWSMPSLKGLSLREALRTLQGKNFQIKVHGQGVIKRQTPPAGWKIPENEVIQLELGE